MELPRRYLLQRGLAASFILPGVAEARRRTLHQSNTGLLPLVVLDPGHGGKDPGAVGITGIYEKHVSLATAQTLSHLLIASGKYRVAMTRSDDSFIKLEHRVDFAHAHKADLFVSMHADALPNPSVRGASVYTMADHASDSQAQAIADSENSADRLGGPSFANEPPMVASILSSLLEKQTKIGSANMARNVVSALGEKLPLLPNPSRHARFMVLRAADIPSVLVEMGMMSNARDEALLHQAAHRKLVASQMKLAIDSYFRASGALTQIAG